MTTESTLIAIAAEHLELPSVAELYQATLAMIAETREADFAALTNRAAIERCQEQIAEIRAIHTLDAATNPDLKNEGARSAHVARMMAEDADVLGLRQHADELEREGFTYTTRAAAGRRVIRLNVAVLGTLGNGGSHE